VLETVAALWVEEGLFDFNQLEVEDDGLPARGWLASSLILPPAISVIWTGNCWPWFVVI